MQDICDTKKIFATLRYLSVEKILESCDPITSSLLFLGIGQQEAGIWSILAAWKRQLCRLTSKKMSWCGGNEEREKVYYIL